MCLQTWAYKFWLHLDLPRAATRCHALMQASDSDIQGASQARIFKVNKEMDCKSGSKAAGKSLQPRVTRSQSVRV